MANLDTNKILNESKPKVLIREFNNLKNDYTKMNAVKYKSFYENEDLSFILANSRYIFSEPIKGLDFYKDVILNFDIPFDSYADEVEKFESFYEENHANMSNEQASLYADFLNKMKEKGYKHVVCLLKMDPEGNEGLHSIYDALYRIRMGRGTDEDKKSIISYFTENFKEGSNYGMAPIIGSIIFASKIPEVGFIAYKTFSTDACEHPNTVEEAIRTVRIFEACYALKRDCIGCIYSIINMNFRFFITGIADMHLSLIISNVMTKKVDADLHFSSSTDMINRIFRDDDLKSSEISNETEKEILPLLIKRAIIVFHKGIIEAYFQCGAINPEDIFYDCINEEEVVGGINNAMKQYNNDVATCNEIIDKFYKTHAGSENYQESTYLERYFSPDGRPGKVVSQSIGGVGEGPSMKKGIDEEPKKAMSSSKIEDDFDKDSIDDKPRKATDDDIKKFFVSQEDASKMRGDIIRFCVETYKNGYKKIDFTDKEDGLGYQPTFTEFLVVDGDLVAKLSLKEDDIMTGSGLDFQDSVRDKLKEKYKDYSFRSDDVGIIIAPLKSVKESSDEEDQEEFSNVDTSIKKPSKKNVFRNIQTKALDADVQFKKAVAKGRRTAVDAKNAVKAITKIPENIVNSIKKQVNDWDEMDDNRRKEYIIKPGVRKRYFRALNICLMHYGAFAINPVLNIVLFICQALGKSKDVRIRNELIRELKAEIKVTEEKINDANANGDQKQKYQLIRIKEKLDAEMTRVTMNSKAL